MQQAALKWFAENLSTFMKTKEQTFICLFKDLGWALIYS